MQLWVVRVGYQNWLLVSYISEDVIKQINEEKLVSCYLIWYQSQQVEEASCIIHCWTWNPCCVLACESVALCQCESPLRCCVQILAIWEPCLFAEPWAGRRRSCVGTWAVRQSCCVSREAESSCSVLLWFMRVEPCCWPCYCVLRLESLFSTPQTKRNSFALSKVWNGEIYAVYFF